MSEERVCLTCHKLKPPSEFYERTDGAQSNVCKECRAIQNADHYERTKDRHAGLVKLRYDTYGRFRRYGITQEMYEAALREQDGKCKLCGAEEPGGKGVWHIDHAHDPGRTTQNGRFNQTDDASLFRGLLCHRCNVSLGHHELLVERIGEDRLMRYLHPERYWMENLNEAEKAKLQMFRALNA